MADNPDATIIPDRAEVWFALKSEVTNLAAMIPATYSADLAALGWGEVGIVDKKIPLNPSGEVKQFDGFGRIGFRYKFKKGKLETGFKAFEWNSVTRKFILPGSAGNKIGAPKTVEGYVLYRFQDDDVSGGGRVWVQLRPALIELKSLDAIEDGELIGAELVVHHTKDANGDVFHVVGGAPLTKVFTIGSGVTSFMVTVDNQPVAVSTLTSAALQTALRSLPNVGSSGVTVTGSGSGPFTAVFTATVINVLAAGVGGDVTVT